WDDPQQLLSTPMGGDWVFRKGATVQQHLDGGAAILSAQLSRPIRFEKTKARREVIVARGTFSAVGSGDRTIVITDLAGGKPHPKPHSTPPPAPARTLS